MVFKWMAFSKIRGMCKSACLPIYNKAIIKQKVKTVRKTRTAVSIVLSLNRTVLTTHGSNEVHFEKRNL